MKTTELFVEQTGATYRTYLRDAAIFRRAAARA
jgi:hypothetical protein